MVNSIFQTIGEVVTKFAQVLGSSVESVVGMFWQAETGITSLGVLGLIGTGTGLVYFGFRLIRRLMRLR